MVLPHQTAVVHVGEDTHQEPRHGISVTSEGGIEGLELSARKGAAEGQGKGTEVKIRTGSPFGRSSHHGQECYPQSP